MENKDEILSALDEFEGNPRTEIPPALERYLVHIAKTGETLFPWPKLLPLFARKLDNVMRWFNEECPTENLAMSKNSEKVLFEEMRSRLLNQLNTFTGAPFTIQRLCELVTEPQKHYKRTDKFLRGIERNVLVVSTVDTHGRKIVREETKMPVVNGDLNGSPDGASATHTNPHAWVTGQITTSWLATDRDDESESCESPSKRPRLSNDGVKVTDTTPTSANETPPSNSTSTIDTNPMEENESPASSTSVSASSEASDSSPDNSSYPSPGVEHVSCVGESQMDRNTASNSCEHAAEKDEFSVGAETDSENSSVTTGDTVSSSDCVSGSCEQLKSENEVGRVMSEASNSDLSAFQIEDSMGFETSNLKPDSAPSANSGDRAACSQSESDTSPVMSEGGDRLAGSSGDADESNSAVSSSDASGDGGESRGVLESPASTTADCEPSTQGGSVVVESEEPMDAE